MKETFQVPIFFNKNKKIVSDHILKDLELIDSMDTSPIYNYCFSLVEQNNLALLIMKEQLSKYFTTDTEFLRENQTLLKSFLPENNVDDNNNSNNNNSMYTLWKSIQEDDSFKAKYHFVQWPCLEFLNSNEFFLQCLSIYSVLSPVVSLIMPFIILILPFFVIRYKGLSCSFEEYLDVLGDYIQHNALGRLFTSFNSVSFQERGYLVMSALFYVFSIYQNIQVCLHFHENMKNIHHFFREIKQYLSLTLFRMESYLQLTKLFTSEAHVRFTKECTIHFANLTAICNEVAKITEFRYSPKKVGEIGMILKTFYTFYANEHIVNAVDYSLGFHGYLDCLIGIQKNLQEKQMHFVEFIEGSTSKGKKTDKTHFIQAFYPPHKDDPSVRKNNIYLNKHMMVSGPNASGKTTIMKTALINILLCQQFGCGFFQRAFITPYHYLHCYLNIPDTSGRDSLFQAEARRCKEILDAIDNAHSSETHFCAFDELYSGTNPEEAAASAIGFLTYISKNKNVDSILTTHFVKVCEYLAKKRGKLFQNYFMETKKKGKHELIYSYKLKKGISEMKGGRSVLHALQYPMEILDNIH